jgi:nitrate reductase assembly molybdenum cofactor insertion protein NarJ
MENLQNDFSRINFIKGQIALLNLEYASTLDDNESFEKLKIIFLKIKKLKEELAKLKQKYSDSFESASDIA